MIWWGGLWWGGKCMGTEHFSCTYSTVQKQKQKREQHFGDDGVANSARKKIGRQTSVEKNMRRKLNFSFTEFPALFPVMNRSTDK